MNLLPKEHGAYGQMAMPLLTSFLVSGVSVSALLLALAIVSGFVAHEPMLVLLGRRGTRAQRELGRRATMWLGVTTIVTVAGGVAGAWLLPRDAWWSLLLPLLPSVVLATAIAMKREKGLVAEIAVALAFSLTGVPLCLAAGADVRTGASVAIVFFAIFVTATLAVRSIVLGTRGGGDPHAARVTRIAALVLAVALLAGLAVAGFRAWLPWATFIAAAPGLAVALWLTLRPLPPTRLRDVGWTLVVTSVAAALTLTFG